MDTLQEIDYILGVINTHPEFHSRYTRSAEQNKRGALLEDARRHSLQIEKTKDGDSYKNLQQAELYLGTNGLSVSTLSQLGHLTDPEKNGIKGFRNVNPEFPDTVVEKYALGELRVQPPVASKVESQIGNLIFYLNNVADHPVVRAAEAHLDFVRIHPYAEGNGRVARILQNFCLTERAYPAAIISADERKVYYGLLQNALAERTSTQRFYPGERRKEDQLFIDFIASKVLKSTRDLESELNKNRAFTVDLTGHYDPGSIHKLAQIIRRHKVTFQGTKVGINRKSNRHKGASLTVIGDVNKKDLENVISSAHILSRPRYRLSYDVKPLGATE